MNLTRFLALWGAIVSTIALGWNIYQAAIQDAPKLELTGGSQIGGMFFLKVTNVRSRPVTIVDWGVEQKIEPPSVGSATQFSHSDLPKVLMESEQATLRVPIGDVLRPDAQRVYVEDTSGKRWYLPAKISAIRKGYEVLEKINQDFGVK